MSQASECRNMVANGQAEKLLEAMSGMLQTVGFEQMSKDVLQERDFSRLQRYARIILRHAVDGNSKPQIQAKFQLLGLV